MPKTPPLAQRITTPKCFECAFHLAVAGIRRETRWPELWCANTPFVWLRLFVVESPTLLGFVTSKIRLMFHRSKRIATDFSVQPRIPEAATSYCTRRANFALGRRTAIVENLSEIRISHRVFHRVIVDSLLRVDIQKISLFSNIYDFVNRNE